MSNVQSQFKISTAERKILIVFCYYVLTTVISLVALTLATRTGEIVIQHITEYFVCELDHPSKPCSRKFEEFLYPYLTATSFVLMGFFPFMILIFLTNFREMKERVVKCLPRNIRQPLTPRPTDSTSSNSGSDSTGTSTKTSTSLIKSHKK